MISIKTASLFAIGTLVLIPVVCAQPGRISLIAGGVPLGEGRPGPEVPLWAVGQIAVDFRGGILFSDRSRLINIDAGGIMHTFAGSRRIGFSGEGGPATLAAFDLTSASGIVFDQQGSVYLADGYANRIRKIDVNGIVRTIAGTGAFSSGGDGGPALQAQIQHPGGIARTPDGVLYIAEPETNRIRRIDSAGIITTFAGDGVARSAEGDTSESNRRRLSVPTYIALDSKQNLYVSDSTAHVVRVISPDGQFSIFAGTGQIGFTGDNKAAIEANLNSPGPLALDGEDNLYIADRGNGRVRVVSPTGLIKTVAGGGSNNSLESGYALDARFRAIYGVAIDAQKRIFIAEGSQRVLVVDSSGKISVFAGTSPFFGNNGPAAFARVSGYGVAADNSGNIFIASPIDSVVQKIDVSGKISIFAGSQFGLTVLAQPIPAESAQLSAPVAVKVDPQGRVLILDQNGRVLRVENGMISRIAGTAQSGYEGDGGPAINAKLNQPNDLAVDTDGVIYVADWRNNRVRRIGKDGIISTIAGNGVATSTGDNGPASAATLLAPMGVAIENNGDLLVTEEHRIRRISKIDGYIRKVIGDGTCSNDLNSGRLCYPGRITVGPAGEIYVVRNGNSVIRLSNNGAKDVLSAFGWRPTNLDDSQQSFSNSPYAVSVGPAGDLFFVTLQDSKVWKAQGNGPFSATPSGLLFSFASGSPPARQSITLEAGDGKSKTFVITSNVPWLTVTPPTGTLTPGAPIGLIVTADPKDLLKGTHLGTLTVRNPDDATQKLDIVVSITISGTPQQLRLSQTGFAFAAVQNGGVSSPRTLQVLNTGIGTMPWTAAATTLAGGNWLQVTPATGISVAGPVAPEIRIAANPAGLASGVYFGLVTVAAVGVDNAPQSATIILNVTTQNQPPGALIEPAGLLFAVNPLTPAKPQEVQFANLTAGDLTYALALAFPKDMPTWASITTSATGRVSAGLTARIEIKANPTGLKPGTYTADLLVTVGSEKIPRTVSLVLVLAEAAAPAKSISGNHRNADPIVGCVPASLIPVFSSPVPMSQSLAGWPTPVALNIVDNCAQPLTAGRVSVSFSTGDPSISLNSEGDGKWSGTWAARTVNSNVVLNAISRSLTPALDGTAKLLMSIKADATKPVISPGGVRNLASQLEGRPIPGAGPVLILGSQFVTEDKTADAYPLPTKVNGTSAQIGGKLLFLRSVSDSRIEGVLPAGVPDSTPLQMLVQREKTYSVPENVIVTLAEPAIFTTAGTGVGQGMVYAVEEDGTRTLADSERPLKPGDRMGILCVGIGPVDQAVTEGVPVPENTVGQALYAVKVMVQNQAADQVTAQLAPGLIGIYWVTATVPKGVTADATADVVVQVQEQVSPPVTVALRPTEIPQ